MDLEPEHVKIERSIARLRAINGILERISGPLFWVWVGAMLSLVASLLFPDGRCP